MIRWIRHYPRFVTFVILLLAGSILSLAVGMHWQSGLLIAFDLSALLFVIWTASALHDDTVEEMRQAAKDQDPNHHVVLSVGLVVLMVVMVAVVVEVRETDTWRAILAIFTLLTAWFFGNLLFALYYAHRYYAAGPDGQDSRGLEFPGDEPPRHWDFFYYAFVIGMTFQVSDVQITSRRMRRLALWHALLAFVFNIAVIGVTVNLVGSLLGS